VTTSGTGLPDKYRVEGVLTVLMAGWGDLQGQRLGLAILDVFLGPCHQCDCKRFALRIVLALFAQLVRE
jgi:hypothetical protein